MKYIVVDIGCLECCAPSDIVGVFTSEEHANAVAETLKSKARLFGHHVFEVFEMPEPGAINPDYEEYFK